MYTYEIYNVDGGYAFNIMCDGNVIITQEYLPDAEGYVAMTENQATHNAKTIINRIEGSE